MSTQSLLKRGARVEATSEMWSAVTRKHIKVGTSGRVMGLRTDPDGRKALVKFEGFSCDKQVTMDQIRKV